MTDPTPSRENDCNNWVQLNYERDIERFDGPLDTGEGEASDCQVFETLNLRESFSDQSLDSYMDTEELLSGSCPLVSDSVATTQEHLAESRLRQKEMDSNPPVNQWNDESYFREDWITKITQHQSKLINPKLFKDVEKIKTWFRYDFNPEDPANSPYQCSLCHYYYSLWKLDKRYKPQISDWYLGSSGENSHFIKRHYDSAAHQTIVHLMMQKKLSREEIEFQKIQQADEEIEQGIHKPTINMMRLVVLEIKKNIALENHADLSDFLHFMGVDVGFGGRSQHTATAMMKSVSELMHTTLLDYMKSMDLPFSIIIDASSDISGIHYMLIQFQIMEFNRPTFAFYRLIELSDDETSEGYFSLLTAKITEDGLDESFKKNLKGWSSDSASTMLGPVTGLKVRMENYLNIKLIVVPCLAHRLQSAVGMALRERIYFQMIDKKCNELYLFYNNQGHKRKQHIRKLAAEMNEELLELIQIYKIRWISSKNLAVTKILRSWKVLVKDLEAINKDSSFKASVRERAEALRITFSSRRFLLILNYICDITETLSVYSKIFQSKDGTIFGMEDVKLKMIEDIKKLKDKPISHLRQFLLKSSCGVANPQPCVDPMTLTLAQKVTFHGIELISGEEDHQLPIITLAIESIATDLENEINSYFPSDIMKLFDSFDHRKFPIGSDPQFGSEGIKQLAVKLRLDQIRVLAEWNSLKDKIKSELENECGLRAIKPREFWTRILNKYDDGWHDLDSIFRVLKTGLVIPIGSADVERAFSQMNFVKNKYKNMMSPKVLEADLRIRLNAPDDLSQFRAVKHALHYLLTHDAVNINPNKKMKLKHSSLLPKPIMF